MNMILWTKPASFHWF